MTEMVVVKEKVDDALGLKAAIQLLLDDRAIRDKLCIYQRSMDRCDPDLGYEVFWDDCKIYVGTWYQGVSGKEFVDSCMLAHPTFFLSSHQITNTLVKINGDRAGSESYAKPYFLHAREDGTFALELQCCRYNDQWEKRNGEWRIVKRVVSMEGDAVIENVGPQGKTDSFDCDERFDDPSYAIFQPFA